MCETMVVLIDVLCIVWKIHPSSSEESIKIQSIAFKRMRGSELFFLEMGITHN